MKIAPPHHIAFSANTAWFLLHFEGGLLKALLQKGYTVHCIAPYDAKIFQELESLGCICHKVEINRKGMNPIQDFKTFLRYRQLLKEINPDSLLNFTIKPVIYGSLASRLFKIPTINTITGLGTAFINSGITETIVKALYKLSQKKVARIFVLNTEDKKVFEAAHLCDPQKLHIIPGAGVNLDGFAYTLPNTGQCLTTFLFIGRILKDKGIMEYINAAKTISTGGNPAVFQILGPFDNENNSAITEKQINESLAQNRYLQYLGETDDVRPAIQNADCIVLPSYREGVPTVLLEAMAIGRPIITTDAPGCNVTVVDGENGYRIPIKDTLALEEAMVKVMNQSHATRLSMGKAGRQRAEAVFSEKSVIAKYMQVITQIS